MRQELFAQFHEFSAETEEQINLFQYDPEPLYSMEAVLNAIIRTIPTPFLVDEDGRQLVPDVETLMHELANNEKRQDEEQLNKIEKPLDKKSAQAALSYFRRYRANLIRFEIVKRIMEKKGMWAELVPSKFSLKLKKFVCDDCGMEFPTFQELYQQHSAACPKSEYKRAGRLGGLKETSSVLW
jgi:hypothetical protein